jgi:SAM-dependent methyltransferase
MPASAVLAGLIAEPQRWLDRRLFQGDQPLIFDNIRGRFTRIDARHIGRETTIDMDTGGSHIFRVLVYALTRGLGLHPVLSHTAGLQGLRGIGLSDNLCYARTLARHFDYTNTFFHKRPFLDICADPRGYSALDFIVASEVFEHVPPPPAVAFRNSWRMLKPGGVLILSVPYADQIEHTVEHYPSLHRWQLRRRPASGGSVSDFYIENVDTQGRHEIFEKVAFHGGIGQTVEMRAFSKRHLLELATQNGFAAEIVTEDVPLFGIWNQGDMNSLPMILRKV